MSSDVPSVGLSTPVWTTKEPRECLLLSHLLIATWCLHRAGATRLKSKLEIRNIQSWVDQRNDRTTHERNGSWRKRQPIEVPSSRRRGLGRGRYWEILYIDHNENFWHLSLVYCRGSKRPPTLQVLMDSVNEVLKGFSYLFPRRITILFQFIEFSLT